MKQVNVFFHIIFNNKYTSSILIALPICAFLNVLSVVSNYVLLLKSKRKYIQLKGGILSKTFLIYNSWPTALYSWFYFYGITDYIQIYCKKISYFSMLVTPGATCFFELLNRPVSISVENLSGNFFFVSYLSRLNQSLISSLIWVVDIGVSWSRNDTRNSARFNTLRYPGILLGPRSLWKYYKG